MNYPEEVEFECLKEKYETLKLDNAKLQEELKRLFGIERPFICGNIGEIDDDGLPSAILVCPAYGSDDVAIYKKHMTIPAGNEE